MKNFHLPLPEQTSSQLRAAIAAYAEEMAGTNFDLDPDLESSGIEHLVTTNPAEGCGSP